jgi:hypothetical protein
VSPQPRAVRHRRYVSVPMGAVFVWWLVVFGSYKSVEKAFLVVPDIRRLRSRSAGHPDWRPRSSAAWCRACLDFGASRWWWASSAPRSRRGCNSTSSPRWSSGVEGVRLRPGAARRGPGLSDGGGRAFFIVIACAATLHREGIHDIVGRRRRAGSRRWPDATRAGCPPWSRERLPFAASIPSATAYSVARGSRAQGVDRSFGEAPVLLAVHDADRGLGRMILLPGRRCSGSSWSRRS